VLAVLNVQEYRMTYRVFDDKFENSTTIVIQVLDVNDNPPRFDNAVYNVLDLNEEEPGISKNSPKYLLTVMFIFIFMHPFFVCIDYIIYTGVIFYFTSDAAVQQFHYVVSIFYRRSSG